MEMPLSELTRRIEKVEALLKEAQALLPGLRTLTEEDRRHSNGRLRGGEAEMLSRVLDAVRTQPGYFASLADEDDGRDPAKLEVDRSRIGWHGGTCWPDCTRPVRGD